MIHYILQTIVFQLFFLLVFDLFLKRETFFNWNRFYLLASMVLSILLPFIKIEVFKQLIPQNYIEALPEIVINNIEAPAVETQFLDTIYLTNTSLLSFKYLLYLGWIISALLFIFKLSKILILAHRNTKIKYNNAILVKLLNSYDAFSFFNYIFLGERIKGEAKTAVINHEEIHVKQKHSLDLLFFEVIRILFWFNPMIYIYQKRIAHLHEFIADSKAVKHNKIAYYQNLLSQVFETKEVSFINPFFKKSLIKKRIIMLNKSKSKQISLLKYTLFIPLVVGMLMYTSCSQEQDNKTLNRENNNSKGLFEAQEVVFSRIDNAPTYPGCEDTLSSIENKECFNEKVKALILENFNTDLADKLGLSGTLKISIFFKISETGAIEDIKARAPHPDLEKEAKRVIALIPVLIPGEHRGKNVKVPYYLPIKFKVNEEITPDVRFETQISKNDEGEIEYVIQATKNQEDNITTIIQNKEISFAEIEKVPVYPGCEDVLSNIENKDCFNEKVKKLIVENFNTGLADKLGLTGIQKISVFFKISKTGDIIDVKARAPHPDLEQEAKRAVSLLPKLRPGEHNGENVIVPYYLPIKFKVNE